MVIYFTGTGNSEYIAKALADKLDDEIVCSNDYMKKQKNGSFESDRPWVFVFPVYLSTIAEIFATFIKNSEFKGCKDAYFVGTCASEMGSTANTCKRLCNIKDFNYKGTARVQMPQNYIVFFKMTPKEECASRQKLALEYTETLSADIKANKQLNDKKYSKLENAMIVAVEKLYNGPFTKTKKFYATDECTGCGLCVKKCPTNNIHLENGKPKWTKACIHCMACINGCPKQSIEYGKKTIGKDRYVCIKYNTQK